MSCTVNEDVVRVLKDFHKAKKPIGLCCIAPVLAVKKGVEVEVVMAYFLRQYLSNHLEECRKIVILNRSGTEF